MLEAQGKGDLSQTEGGPSDHLLDQGNGQE